MLRCCMPPHALTLLVVAQVRGELTKGLSGAPLREAQRGLSAAHDAYVTVAMDAGAAVSAESWREARARRERAAAPGGGGRP